MSKKKSSINIAASLLYKIIVCVIGLLIPRLFVISYGSELNGLQNSVTQIFMYISLLEAGIGEATLQSLFGPIAKKDYTSANAILSATTSFYKKIGALYCCILLLLAIVYPIIVPVDSISYFEVVIFIIFSGLSTGLNYFYQSKIILVIQAEGDMYIISFVNMGVHLLSSIGKIVFILCGFNIVLIQIGFFSINLLGTFIYFIIAKRKFPWINFKVKPNMEALSQRNSVLIHKLAGIVFQNTDIVILTIICGLKVVSVYSMYKLVINTITTITASFGESFHYIFGQTFNAGKKENYIKIIDTFNVYYSTIAFGLFTVTSILIIPFLKLDTVGMDLNYIYPILPFLFISIEVLQVGREAMMRTIQVAGHFKNSQYSAIIEMVINLIVSIVAVFLFKNWWGDIAGLYGVLIGTIVALLYRTIDVNHYANVNILKRGSTSTNLVMIINIALYAVIAFVFYNIKLSINTYIDFFIHGVVITIIILLFYLSVQSLFHIQDAKRLITYLKGYTKTKK